jgi:hypothetical protein
MRIALSTAWECLVLTAILTGPLAAQSTSPPASGVVSYVFDPNPQEIKPKMYNWEIRLTESDGKALYEIVQATTPVGVGGVKGKIVVTPLIESKLIVPGPDGATNFHLYIGDKVPKRNMGRVGDTGEPIIFSGAGTGKAASTWIVLPGDAIDRVSPAVAGTRLTDGTLTLIRFVVRNDRGAQFQTDVVLRRSPPPQ